MSFSCCNASSFRSAFSLAFLCVLGLYLVLEPSVALHIVPGWFRHIFFGRQVAARITEPEREHIPFSSLYGQFSSIDILIINYYGYILASRVIDLDWATVRNCKLLAFQVFSFGMLSCFAHLGQNVSSFHAISKECTCNTSTLLIAHLCPFLLIYTIYQITSFAIKMQYVICYCLLCAAKSPPNSPTFLCSVDIAHL